VPGDVSGDGPPQYVAGPAEGQMQHMRVTGVRHKEMMSALGLAGRPHSGMKCRLAPRILIASCACSGVPCPIPFVDNPTQSVVCAALAVPGDRVTSYDALLLSSSRTSYALQPARGLHQIQICLGEKVVETRVYRVRVRVRVRERVGSERTRALGRQWEDVGYCDRSAVDATGR